MQLLKGFLATAAFFPQNIEMTHAFALYSNPPLMLDHSQDFPHVHDIADLSSNSIGLPQRWRAPVLIPSSCICDVRAKGATLVLYEQSYSIDPTFARPATRLLLSSWESVSPSACFPKNMV